MTYNPIQEKWLKYHFRKWRDEFGWDAATFAEKTKQPPDALATALGVPLEDFGPPPQIAVPDELVALPNPETAIITIEGVEIMPRAKPPAAAAVTPPPSPTVGEVLLTAGSHVINGEQVEVPGRRGELVRYALPFGRYTIDNKLVHVNPHFGFHIV